MLKHGPKPFDPKLSGCFKIAPLFSAIWSLIFTSCCGRGLAMTSKRFPVYPHWLDYGYLRVLAAIAVQRVIPAVLRLA